MTWWFTTFMAPAIKQKVHSLPGVEYLYSVMSPDQLEIPAFITEYDMTVSFLHPWSLSYENLRFFRVLDGLYVFYVLSHINNFFAQVEQMHASKEIVN